MHSLPFLALVLRVQVGQRTPAPPPNDPSVRCFGPIFLAYMLTTRVTSNDDLPHLLDPHVVRAINSLE